MSALPYMYDRDSFMYEQYKTWRCLHDRSIYVDATPTQIGIVDGEEVYIISLPRAMPIYLAEYLAALLGAIVAGSRPVTLFSDNMGVVWNFDLGRCPREWLGVLCFMFKNRNFSVRYIPTACNPADVPSRARTF